MRVLPAGVFGFRSLSPILGLISVAAMLSCSDSHDPPVGETCPENVVTLAVPNPTNATPSFNWTPACAVAHLEVTAVAPGSGVVWSISGRLQNILGSGISYGQVPFGAEEDVAAVPLQTGATYEVRVARAISTSSGTTLGGGGVVTFTH